MKTFLRLVGFAAAAALLASAGHTFAQDTNAAPPTIPATAPAAPTTPATLPAAPTGLSVSTDTTSTNTPPAKPKKKKKKKPAADATATADSATSAKSKAITGDVTKVDDDSKTLTVSGQDKPFGITSKTKITKNGDPAILLDIVVGDHVTIHAKDDPTGNPLATSIRVGQVKAKKSKKAKTESESTPATPDMTTPAAAPATTTPATPAAAPATTGTPATPPATGGTAQ